MAMSAVRHPALQREEPLRTLLDEDDDEDEDRDFREHRARPAFEHLIQHAESEAGVYRARKLADAAEHHDHERVDDIRLPEVRPDVADLREGAAGESRDSRAQA